MQVQHKGYLIEVNSYRSTGGKWRPNIHVSLHTGPGVTTQSLIPPETALFDTEAEADAYGAQHGARWIDNRG
jgi:hypothetical protein